MLISFILPIYNVGDYLERCLDSIVNQEMEFCDYEIIAVDDGSTDDSLAVLNSYKNKTMQSGKAVNLHILSQQNGGASAARNAGLKIAKGDYIWWIDGDDCIVKGCAPRLLHILQQENLDVLNFAASIMYDSGQMEELPIRQEYVDKVMSGVEFLTTVGVPPNVWSSIYKRQFLISNNLTMKEGVVHEDLEFPPRVYYFAKRVSLSSINAYCYLQREGSVMRTSDPKKVAKKAKDLLSICDSLYQFVEEHMEERTKVYSSFMDKIAFAFSQSLKNYTVDMFDIAEYKNKPYYPLKYSDKVRKSEKIKYSLINFSLSLYLFLITKRNYYKSQYR